MIPITQVTREYVQVNSEGYRINSSHWNCSIDQSVVDSILLLRDEFNLGYGTLGKVFNLPRGTIAKIIKGRIRCQTPDRWKTIYKTRTSYRKT